MKIVITSAGDSLDSNLDNRFGRCSYFMFYNTESSEYEFFPNENKNDDEKAEVAAMRFIKSKGAEKAITRVFGIKINR